MTRIKDLSGQKIGALAVKERALDKVTSGGNHRVCWRCICDCGKETVVPTSALIYRRIQSCGCRIWKVSPDAALLRIFRGYQKSKPAVAYGFTLTLEDFRRLTSGNCFYCGAVPAKIKRLYGRGGKLSVAQPYTYNGVDRVHNDCGYHADNVVSCCARCNKAKGADTQQEFIIWLERIANFRLGKSTSNLV